MPLLATSATFVGFADYSPAQLREILVPEEHEAFDAQFRATLASAAETFSLDELEGFLEHWRRVAWSQHDMGHDAYRAMLARAEHTLRTGETPPGTVPKEKIEELIGARLGRRR
ncbi:MAG: DUF6247 family protein [Actinobacteria bacterium]|nr:DUF6247 family protein [Actinomycetota bacterium]